MQMNMSKLSSMTKMTNLCSTFVVTAFDLRIYCYMVSVSGRLVGAPKILPPTSGKHCWSGRAPTLPSASTLIGYLRRWPVSELTSLAAYLHQLSSAILFTSLTHSKLSGCSNRSSTDPSCSAQRDILYPYICSRASKCSQDTR